MYNAHFLIGFVHAVLASVQLRPYDGSRALVVTSATGAPTARVAFEVAKSMVHRCATLPVLIDNVVAKNPAQTLMKAVAAAPVVVPYSNKSRAFADMCYSTHGLLKTETLTDNAKAGWLECFEAGATAVASCDTAHQACRSRFVMFTCMDPLYVVTVLSHLSAECATGRRPAYVADIVNFTGIVEVGTFLAVRAVGTSALHGATPVEVATAALDTFAHVASLAASLGHPDRFEEEYEFMKTLLHVNLRLYLEHMAAGGVVDDLEAVCDELGIGTPAYGDPVFLKYWVHNEARYSALSMHAHLYPFLSLHKEIK